MRVRLAVGSPGVVVGGWQVHLVGTGHLTLPDGTHRWTVELRVERGGEVERVHLFQGDEPRAQVTLGLRWRVVGLEGGPDPAGVVVDVDEG